MGTSPFVEEARMKNSAFGLLLIVSMPMFAQSAGYPEKQCQTVEGSDQQICAHVSINGCTVEGRNYAEDVSCQVVRKQGRPFRPIPAPREPDPNDARLQDPVFMEELSWVTNQVRSCGCACCHDTSKLSDFSLWDINKPNVWITQLTRRGSVIMSGQLESTVGGNIPPSDNNGFDRTMTGAPTTDVARFKAFFVKEVESRGITADEIAKMRPFNLPTRPPQ